MYQLYLYWIVLYIVYTIIFIRSIYFKDNLRTIEAQFPKKLRTTEAHFEFTGPYKKSEMAQNSQSIAVMRIKS